MNSPLHTSQHWGSSTSLGLSVQFLRRRVPLSVPPSSQSQIARWSCLGWPKFCSGWSAEEDLLVKGHFCQGLPEEKVDRFQNKQRVDRLVNAGFARGCLGLRHSLVERSKNNIVITSPCLGLELFNPFLGRPLRLNGRDNQCLEILGLLLVP